MHRYIQFIQASESGKCATSNRCDRVAGQVPARAVCENCRLDVAVQGNIQFTKAHKSSKCVTSNRCDLVVAKAPARIACAKSDREVAVKA